LIAALQMLVGSRRPLLARSQASEVHLEPSLQRLAGVHRNRGRGSAERQTQDARTKGVGSSGHIRPDRLARWWRRSGIGRHLVTTSEPSIRRCRWAHRSNGGPTTSGPPMPWDGCPRMAPITGVPGLRQRTLALRVAPRSGRWRLPAHVCRPHPGPEDATM